jgi:hypothetical protein
MLEPDTTSTEVLLMYLGWFVGIFTLAIVLMKKNS